MLFSAGHHVPHGRGRSGGHRRWKTVCPNLCIEPAEGDHFSMLREPHVELLAERLDRLLDESDGGDGRPVKP